MLPVARRQTVDVLQVRGRPPTARQQRRDRLDSAVKESFDESGGTPGTYGSPRVWEDLDEAGWAVSVNTVASSMARQGLVGRSPKRKRRSLTRPDKAAAPIRDLVRRDYSTGPVWASPEIVEGF
ncbi:MAG: putative transposase [Acidimicrobiales bacterium]|jgi:putative transposase